MHFAKGLGLEQPKILEKQLLWSMNESLPRARIEWNGTENVQFFVYFFTFPKWLYSEGIQGHRASLVTNLSSSVNKEHNFF